MTLTKFCETFAGYEKLIRAVVKQAGGWKVFHDTAEQVTDHGADCGFSGFTFYYETEAFTKKHRSLILELAACQANDYGQAMGSMICGFGCLGDVKQSEVDLWLAGIKHETSTTIANALAWYALEEVSRWYGDAQEWQ